MTSNQIDQGWIDWMNDKSVTKHLISAKKEYTRSDLLDYLNADNHILFLACYDEFGTYFGNLRLYELKPGYASFGRLIGLQAYRGVGYGRAMIDAAHYLLFDEFKYDMMIVGNLRSNEVSRRSKLAIGYELLGDDFLSGLGIVTGSIHEYYGFSRSSYGSELPLENK